MKDFRLRYVDRVREALAGDWDKLISPAVETSREDSGSNAPNEDALPAVSAERPPAP